ncbi:MAG: N-acetylmuramoyl-L-alanine amidase [Pseudomonadota bacterium]
MTKKIIAKSIPCFILILLFLMSDVFADTSEGEYQKAYQAFKSLELSKTKRKSRNNWINCASNFESIYKKYPKNSRADDAMYMAGKVYQYLYGYSNRGADLDKAIQLYQKMTETYPKSKLADDAQFRIAEIYEKHKNDKSKAYIEYSKVVSKYPNRDLSQKAKLSLDRLKQFKPTTTTTASEEYKKAYQEFKSLENSNIKRKSRKNWIQCAENFENIYEEYPEASRADDAIYMAGKVYQYLYGYSNREADLDKAIQLYQRMIESYPKSKLADDAQFRIAVIYEKYKNDKSKAYIEYSQVVSNYPNGDLSQRSKLSLDRLKQFKPITTTKRSSIPEVNYPIKDTKNNKEIRSSQSEGEASGLVTDIRYWSNPDYTRIVIDVDKKISYYNRLLKKDPSIQKPERLYVDLFGTRISPKLKEPIPIQDGLLKMVRTGQYTKDCVRVVLDIESIKSYKILPLEDPFRIVIDVIGKNSTAKDGHQIPGDTKSLSLSRQLGLGIGRIVIDPGHGGHDPGAIGPSGLKEKDVVLKIAKKLEGIIKENLGCEVVLTRRDDIFIPLEERTAIANTHKADLFISIHANASLNRNAHGIETYFLNFSTDEEAMKVAARENATSTKKISDLKAILQDLMLNSKINESSTLAGHIQKSLTGKLKNEYSDIRNLGVKQAPFYVLIGAEMPSILVEVSFISNTIEEERLKDLDYIEKLASSIFTGIKGYINGIKIASF